MSNHVKQTTTGIDYNKLSKLIADRVVKKLGYKANWLNFDEARQQLFRAKSRPWIYQYIFHDHPEVLTTHGGWVTPPKGRGTKIKVIDLHRAKEWMKKHGQEIDWDAAEPDPRKIERAS